MEIPLRGMEGGFSCHLEVADNFCNGGVSGGTFSKTSLEKMASCFGKPEWSACRNFDAGLYHGSRRNKRQLKQRSSQIRARIMQYGFASWGDIRVASFALTGDAGSVCSYGQSVKSSSNLLKSRGWRAGQPGL